MVRLVQSDETLPAESRGASTPVVTEERSDELARGITVGRYMVLGKLGAGGMGVVYAAYDPELDRKVALKLLLPRADGGSVVAGRARLLREAQALAKLSHPNVVAVHDVGTYGEGVWVGMELVTGATLGAWAAARPRRWPEILRVLTEVARGVAAAHGAGLVHRDLKPDNVMIGEDGRVRVMDFGLAHGRMLAGAAIDLAATVSSDSKARPELAALALRLTQAGSIQGTPSYMAPEQWLGEEAEAAADQFGWSVMAWELLYGERPFSGETIIALAASVLAGQRRAPPKGRRVPSWLRRVIERGLASEPRRRWPTMDALLAALGHGTARAQVWVASAAAMGIAALAAAASYLFVPRPIDAVASCQEAVAKPEELWGTAQKSTVERALTATGVEYAADVWRRVDKYLDQYAAEWSVQHIAVCEAHVVGTQTSHLLDLRSACLGRRKSHASQLINILSHADPVVAANAVQAVTALPNIRSCADAELLLAEVPPPDGATAESVGVLRAQLARATALETTGQYQAGLRLAAEARVAASALGYAPLDAEAAMVEGRTFTAAGKHEEADAALSRAIELALAHDLHAIAAEATARRIFILGEGLGRPAEAIAIRLFAEALVARAGSDSGLAALLNNNLGAVYAASGNQKQALVHFGRSLDILQREGVTNDPIAVAIHNNIGSIYIDAKELGKTRFHYMQAIELCTKILGHRHPFGAHPLAGLGDVEAREGHLDAAIRNYSESLEIMEASYGPDHLYLLHPLIGLGQSCAAAGRKDEARRYYERGVKIVDKLGLEQPYIAEAIASLAELAVATGDLVQARALSDRAAKASITSVAAVRETQTPWLSHDEKPKTPTR